MDEFGKAKHFNPSDMRISLIAMWKDDLCSPRRKSVTVENRPVMIARKERENTRVC